MAGITHLPLPDATCTSKLARRIDSRKTRQTQGGRVDDVKTGWSRSQKTAWASTDSYASSVRGVKRDARGRTKSSQSGLAPSSPLLTGHACDPAILLEEVLALGGSQQDLDLVADALSDDDSIEMQGRAQPVGQGLRKELAQFAAGLGLEQLQDQCIVNSDAELKIEEAIEHKHSLREPNGSNSPIPMAQDLGVRSYKSLICEPRPDWHAIPLAELPVLEAGCSRLSQQAISNLGDHGATILGSDSDVYASRNLSNSSSHRFLSTIMSSGTLSDKVSALTLVVQESPVHNRKALEALLALTKKRSRGQAITAIRAVTDLFSEGNILPATRRLRSFVSQPELTNALRDDAISTWTHGQALPGGLTEQHLMIWAFEDWLKGFYFELITVLESWCNDEVDYARSQAVAYVYSLLKQKPEQESNLLRLLTNKLGDPEKKIASRVSYLLLQMEISHPSMKSIIVEAVEYGILLRPGQSTHARYYAIITLNQTILSSKEETLARSLLRIYFDFFVSLLKDREYPSRTHGRDLTQRPVNSLEGNSSTLRAKKKRVRLARQISQESLEKLMSAVLTGINRAIPFSGVDHSMLETYLNTLFRITHSSNFNSSIQALLLIEQLVTSRQVAVDRFYRTLYESLLDPRLITSSKHALYLNLLFRTMKSDLEISRIKAFAKRLLQIMGLHQPPFICGAFYLLKELEKQHPGLKSLLSDWNWRKRHVVDREELVDANSVSNRETSGPSSGPIQTLPLMGGFLAYNGLKRDPVHSHADNSCLWELVPYLSHFHPSVAMFASSLLTDTRVPPKPDLASHTLANFLDRFAYRNAKIPAITAHGSSIMQPVPFGARQGNLLCKKVARRSEPLNSESSWRKQIQEVDVDEVFFHTYFNQIGQNQVVKKKPTADFNDTADEDEDGIWQALVHSRPEDEEDSSEGSVLSDLDMSDHEAEDRSFEDNDRFSTGEHGEQGYNPFGNDPLAGDESVLNPSEIETETETEREEHAASAKKGIHRKQRISDLPTFAALADYAHLMAAEDSEDLG